MNKIFKMNDGYKRLSTEEMLEQFEGLICKWVRDTDEKLGTIFNNVYDRDDYKQMAIESALEAYRAYDIDKDVCMSTFLTNVLFKKYTTIKRGLVAKKRNGETPLIYLDMVTKSGDEYSNLVPAKKEEEVFELSNVKLEEFLLDNLTSDERMFLAMALQKNYHKAKGSYKASLGYTISLFADRVHPSSKMPTRADLAVEIGLSRPTLNKRIDLTLKKTQGLAKEFLREQNLDMEI